MTFLVEHTVLLTPERAVVAGWSDGPVTALALSARLGAATAPRLGLSRHPRPDAPGAGFVSLFDVSGVARGGELVATCGAARVRLRLSADAAAALNRLAADARPEALFDLRRMLRAAGADAPAFDRALSRRPLGFARAGDSPARRGPRLAIVAHGHPAFRRGGGEVAAHRQFRHLRAAGADVCFLGAMADEGRPVREIAPGDFALNGAAMDPFRLDHARLAQEDAALEALLGLEADVYHFHHLWNIGARTIRRLMDARPDAAFALTLHEYLTICANHGQMVKTGSGALCDRATPEDCAACFPRRTPADFAARRARLLALIERFDLVVAPCRFLRARAIEWGVSADRVHVIENGLPDVAAPPPAPAADRLRRFAFFGRATPTKGLDVLARAAAELEARGVRGVEIAAWGATREEFAAAFPNAPAPPELLRFAGPYAPEDAVDLMRRYGWVVVPSTWWENSPVVMQEARQAGARALTSDLGGMAEKAAGWGLTFRAGDPADLAGRIERILSDPDGVAAELGPVTPPLTVGAAHREFAARLSARTGGRIELAV